MLFPVKIFSFGAVCLTIFKNLYVPSYYLRKAFKIRYNGGGGDTGTPKSLLQGTKSGRPKELRKTLSNRKEPFRSGLRSQRQENGRGSRSAWGFRREHQPCRPSRRPVLSQPSRPPPAHRRHPALTMSARRKTETRPSAGIQRPRACAYVPARPP